MAALPNVPGVIKVTMKWSSSADADVLCRFFMSYTGTAPTSTQLNTFSASVGTAYSTNMASLANTDVTLDNCYAIDLTSATAGTGQATTVVAGTLGGGALSAGTAALVNLSVARRYRGGKPRLYFPFGSSTTLATGTAWTGTFVTNVNAGYAAFITAVKAAVWTGGTLTNQVNISYYHGFTVVTNPTTGRARNVPTLRAGGPVPDVISGGTLNVKPASQRRRNLH